MPINVNDPEYVVAQKEYDKAVTPQEKLIHLQKMISHAPKHKGAENLRQQLTTRRKKLEEQIQKNKKSGKGQKSGIKKEDLQTIIIGKTNSGKSTLLKILTNVNPKISQTKFTTTQPIVGMLNHKNVPIQLVENPAIESEYYDKGLPNTADTIIVLVNSIEEIKEIVEKLKTPAKKIIVYNDKEDLDENQKRKINANLQSKKYNFVFISTITLEGIEELKEKILDSFDMLRIFTKEPGKAKSPYPIIMEPHSTVTNVAEKILKGFSKKIKQTKIYGPSAKFLGQSVGLKHELKDLDVVEFKTN
jgi:ribosome-interacting GTPase 1